MRKIILALCLFPLPLCAQNLQGQWQATIPSQPAFMGTFLIDAERRVTADAPNDGGKPARFRGYIPQADGGSLQFTLTDGGVVVRTYCAIQSSDFLQCQTVFPDGKRGDAFMLKRVGPGPRSLMRVSG